MDTPNESSQSGQGELSPALDKESLRKVTSGFQPGDVILDRYEVLRMLGRGGMGIVYLVRDRESDQQIALKTLLPQYVSHSHAVSRFVREVKAARQLDHPYIVKIYDARQVGALIFYTMEYVDGISLFKWMKKRGQMGLGSVVRILSLLCHALEHAHQFTVHRDLSPDNVMVLQDGSVKLLDFGLAKLTNAQSSFTMIGVSLGKQEYMAPEQRISAAEVDLRADIYSLGVMFFEMLVGRLPKGDERITDERPDLPLEADAFVKKAMAKNPDERFRNARDFRHALNYVFRLTKGEATEPVSMPTPAPETATPPPPTYMLVPKPSLGARIAAPFRRILARFRKRHSPSPPSESRRSSE